MVTRWQPDVEPGRGTEHSVTSLKVHWYLPTAGDARRARDGGTNVVVQPSPDPRRFRLPSHEYLSQVALNLERLGFYGVLTPTGSFCEESWITTASLLPLTKRLKFMVALHPRSVQPNYFALQASTFQRLSGGRLLLNVVTGEPGTEALKYGDRLTKEEQYERTHEFLSIVKPVLQGETVSFKRTFFDVEGLSLLAKLGPFEPPTFYFGGSSQWAGPVAAAHADVYLSWLEPIEQQAEKIAWIRSLAQAAGREIRFGVRSWIVARESDEVALDEAAAQLIGFDDADLAAASNLLHQRQSVGQQRGLERIAGRRGDDLFVAPNLWGGFGLIAGGPSLALVGSYEHLADRIEEYCELGVEEFIFGGFPNLEESTYVGEGLLGELQRRGLINADARADPSTRALVDA